MSRLYYLCFSVNKLPDLTLKKYSVFDGSSVQNIMDKHGVFLRQLHRLGFESGVYFHLLYYYNPAREIPKGQHLTILFYATAANPDKLNGIREFLTTSVLSTYYDFLCYEVAQDFRVVEEPLNDGTIIPVLALTNISGHEKKYSLGKKVTEQQIENAKAQIAAGERSHIVCEIASDADVMLSFNRMPVDECGRIMLDHTFQYGAFLTKKDYSLPAQNRLNTDSAGETMLYSIMEWEPCETGRLYNVLKLMEGYNSHAVLRIDIFPVEHTQAIRQRLPYTETRRRISDRVQGKDDNSENIVRSWDKYLNNLMKFPQFLANVAAFADTQDIAVMLADSVAAEAVESGTYLVEIMENTAGFSMYESDAGILHAEKDQGNYVAPFLSLYTLEEIRPMFSFPILYPGEAIEYQKETDPVPFYGEAKADPETGELHEVISLGISSMGYDVTFPVKLFKKHAFIAGVPGAGKTNTMLHLVTAIWRDTKQHVPFLVLEPAKQEYRALAKIKGMEDLCVFSPGADTRFPLHINPFQFPIGLTLAEHIANLNAVFAGAFELIPPSPFLIDGCIEKVYLAKGWNINERNDGSKEYPTMQELYDSLEIAVEESGYEGESKSNIRSVMEVRIGSLLRREIGNVYNVRESSMQPEDWISRPVIIELEALGEGPANFMSLLISTLIREVLKVRKTSDLPGESRKRREVEHVIFYEEAHNLIGPTTDDPVGGSVDPKISATKYLVKMLAEVRALGEGIVIADQLPSVMAPEVLKNTGLKLGHRITAQDDRSILGSTMNASADQLEEQGTFGTGEALIFYENLLKPFKMRVCEWEKGEPGTKYDSPTNLELFEHLKDNKTYNILLARSAVIMQDKMKTEFDALRRQAERLKKEINKTVSDVEGKADSLALLEKKLARLTDDEEIAAARRHIAVMKLEKTKAEAAYEGVHMRKIKKLCRDYANQYFAYITLSKNYSVYSDDMFLCTVKNYLSIFPCLKSLFSSPALARALLEETSRAMKDLNTYVDIDRKGSPARLSGNSKYKSVVFDGIYYLENRIAVKQEELNNRAKELAGSTEDAEQEITEFGGEFSSYYFTFLHMAEEYYKIADILSEKLRDQLQHTLQQKTPEWEETSRRKTEYDKRKKMLYRSISLFVSTVFKSFENIIGTGRAALLNQTVQMRASFRTLVDYRDRSAKTLLSDWSIYKERVWPSTLPILMLEMNAQFNVLHQRRLELAKRVQNAPTEEDLAALRRLCKQYNGLFRKYEPIRAENFNYTRVLTENYTLYLNSVLSLGLYTHAMVEETSDGNWKKCSRMIRQLTDNEQTSKRKEAEWINLSVIMKSICEKE